MAQDAPIYPLPREGELVAFPHGAAGHQGISSNAAGDLIIKPCTQAEIDFYEAAKQHTDFQAHMPVYMGKLELGNKTPVQGVAPATEQGTMSPTTDAHTATNSTEKAPSATEDQPEPGKGEGKEEEKAKAWIPSGGKKLETGLAIVLENAVASFKKPNVIDLKLGARLWDDDAPEAKRQKLDQVAAETTSGSLGFRVAGAKIWLGSAAQNATVEANTEIKDGYKSFNKNYGRNLNEETVQQAIARFISGTVEPTLKGRTKSWLGSDEARSITERMIREIESIGYVLEHEESRMYSASILIVIEGDQEALQAAMAAEAEDQARQDAEEKAGDTDQAKGQEDIDDDDDDEEESVVGPKVMEVRLIDFAHAKFTPGQGPDENALRGVRSIIQILKEICA